jgi:hypothetical protein
MLKSKELSDPQSCLNKARPDERLFVLLARDSAAPETIRYWVQRRLWLGKNKREDPQIVEALDCARLMEHEQDHTRELAAGMHDPATCWHCINTPKAKPAKAGTR